VLELADAVAVNKADGDNVERAKMARRQYETAFHLLSPPYANWSPPVVTCSSITMAGLENILTIVLDHRDKLTQSGELLKKRKEQAREWLKFMVCEGVEEWFYESPAAEILARLLTEVEEGIRHPHNRRRKSAGQSEGGEVLGKKEIESMNILKIDHIGIAVKNPAESSKLYEMLGISSAGVEEVAEQKVKVCFFPVGDSEIELLESTDPSGPIARYIEKTAKAFSIWPCGWIILRRRWPNSKPRAFA